MILILPIYLFSIFIVHYLNQIFLQTSSKKILHPFLRGGGELGAIIREYDWSSSPIGNPETWPQSLRITLGLILNSGFPMLLFWGKELTCFYNDAFRPSLGVDGKHPGIGKPGKELWNDVWNFTGPLLEQVMQTGEPVYYEDQLVPFYRNGRMEEIYWTFSYSPAYGDDGQISGVLVTCTETTEKILNERRLEKSASNLHNIILQAPVAMCILRGPDHIVEVANEKMYRLWGQPAEVLLGRPIFEALPEVKEQGFEELLHRVLTNGETIKANGRPVSLPRNDNVETVYVNFVYEPYRDQDGQIAGVMAVGYDVTEQVMANRKIEESEQRVRTFVENAPFPIGVYTGREMTIGFTNQSIMDVWGKGNDVVGKRYADVLPELENQAIYEQLDEVYMTGIPFHAKNQRVDLVINGELKPFYFNYSFTPLFDLSGKVYGVMNTAADVTDLVIAKQNIEASELRFHLLADSMPQFVWAADDKGQFNYFNKALYKYSGLSEEQLINEQWENIIHPAEKEETIARWKRSVETGSDFILHHRFRNSSGDYRWQLSRAIPQHDSDGNIQMWIGTSTDIHEHKLFEEELTNQVRQATSELLNSQYKIEESAARLSAVFNHAQSGMFIFEPVRDEKGEVIDFRFVITNPTFASYVGQTPEVLNGSLGSKWFPGYMQNGVFEMYKKTYLTGEPQRIDIHYNVDQLDIYLDLQSIKLGDEVLVTFTDYTELKMAQLQLERFVDDLKRSNANLADFAYAASHDLKEPIRKIQYFSDKIRSSIGERFLADEAKYFERMEAAAKRMGALIDDLLSYSQVSVRPRVLEEVDLGYVVNQVLGDLEIEIEEKGASILIGELPVLMGHQRQIQQAFQNLVSNALKFHKKDEAPVIEIRSKITDGADLGLNFSFEQQQKQFHVIDVIDNGIGFDQSDAERIFNVFTRLHGNIEYRGTGIGLSIVRKVAENHNGFVFSKSELGKGATFTIVLPA